MAEKQTVEDKLKHLYKLQIIDTEIDNVQKLRGELPEQIKDMEDELEGLETRNSKIETEINNFSEAVAEKKIEIKSCEAKIEKYKEQQSTVKNNREYDSLTKEIEFQALEIQLCKKRIKEYNLGVGQKKELFSNAKENFKEKKTDLKQKKTELKEIVTETKKNEESLEKKKIKLEKKIEPQLLAAYKRLHANLSNKLAVVPVDRSSCGGCFNKIPPQRQLDIASRKRIIVCEHCGRILVDSQMGEE